MSDEALAKSEDAKNAKDREEKRLSRAAASECSPRRKPWEDAQSSNPSPAGATLWPAWTSADFILSDEPRQPNAGLGLNLVAILRHAFCIRICINEAARVGRDAELSLGVFFHAVAKP